MYLLEAPDESLQPFREVWAGLGDSIVVVGGEGLWNCHIHTDDIGAAIEAALEAGRPRRIRVSDLWEQVEEERWVREAAGAGAGEEPDPQPVRCAVVAVCTGDGIRRIFRSLGVHQVVSGGQSMNPSTSDLLTAIDAAPGEQVVVLPNNKNIVPVAEQAALLAGKPVRVIPTPGIQEGFAALLEYDPEGDAEANQSLMSESSLGVVAGEVTRAVRASTCDAGPIAEGDYLGLSRQGIEVVAADLSEAATRLLDRLIDADHHEIVTIIAGEGAGAADTRRITEWLDAHHPDVASEVHQGGQPSYPYLFSIE
jgi:dihydroxyacetone kinase-like predicted kinase